MEFLKYCKNHFKYKLYKILLYILILFVFLILFGKGVNAEIIENSFIGYTSDTITVPANSSLSGRTYATVNLANKFNFLYFDLCGTKNDNFLINNISQVTGNLNLYSIYYTNNTCQINEWSGYITRIYFSVDTWDDAGNGNFGVIANMTFNPNADYHTVYKINNVNTSPNIDVSDLTIKSQEQIQESINDINNSITNSQNNINQNIDDMESAIIDSNTETQEVIKDQFNDCRDSYNLLKQPYLFSNSFTSSGLTFTLNKDYSITVSGTATADYYLNLNYFYEFKSSIYNNNKIQCKDGYCLSAGLDYNANNDLVYITFNKNSTYNKTFYPMITIESNKDVSYESYGKICKNKLDEAEETRKGIWATIKDLPNSFMEMLKGLFIPSDDYFTNWFNDLKSFFEEKLGFLVTPFTIFIDFVNMYLELDSSTDIIINIPDITVPNFEDNIIIQAQTFNWSQLLRSKESLNTLWQLYLSFVDVFLILNFIGLCETKYNRIFGGDTSNYEYYTVEDSISYDGQTGEVTGRRQNERRTTRKRVN